ncbi:MAG: hypothetical protein FWC10_03710 [Lentimicrobiaceae bacterium]|nr:hypothetical protein [Lentimicrobiaceae bacterium]
MIGKAPFADNESQMVLTGRKDARDYLRLLRDAITGKIIWTPRLDVFLNAGKLHLGRLADQIESAKQEIQRAQHVLTRIYERYSSENNKHKILITDAEKKVATAVEAVKQCKDKLRRALRYGQADNLPDNSDTFFTFTRKIYVTYIISDIILFVVLALSYQEFLSRYDMIVRWSAMFVAYITCFYIDAIRKKTKLLISNVLWVLSFLPILSITVSPWLLDRFTSGANTMAMVEMSGLDLNSLCVLQQATQQPTNFIGHIQANPGVLEVFFSFILGAIAFIIFGLHRIKSDSVKHDFSHDRISTCKMLLKCAEDDLEDAKRNHVKLVENRKNTLLQIDKQRDIQKKKIEKETQTIANHNADRKCYIKRRVEDLGEYVATWRNYMSEDTGIEADKLDIPSISESDILDYYELDHKILTD